MALKPPVEVPQGAIRLNTDSQKLEFYAQDQWWEMATDVPTLDGGARALIAGGDASNTIEYITISTQGNGIDFGDLAEITYQQASFGSNTRSICSGGAGPSTNPNDVIEFLTFASLGNSTDFGNLTVARRNPSGVSNQTRGITAGGGNGPETTVYNTIDYVTIASTGNAVDFGDKTNVIMTASGSINSPTRGVFAGGAGTAPSYPETNVMDYINIATTGAAQDFGDMLQATAAAAGCSNAVRGVIAGGATNLVPSPQTLVNTITSINIAARGNAVNFGDLSAAQNSGHSGGMSSPVRGVFVRGYVSPGPTATRNVISYITIATLGDSVDFGDTTVSERYRSANSNAHGGL